MMMVYMDNIYHPENLFFWPKQLWIKKEYFYMRLFFITVAELKG